MTIDLNVLIQLRDTDLALTNSRKKSIFLVLFLDNGTKDYVLRFLAGFIRWLLQSSTFAAT